TRLFEPESLDQLSDLYTIVLYSNGGTHAAQAWVLLQQMGIKSYVMLGGLNYWVDAILNPQPPGDLAADSEILQYQFRKGASGFFNGGGVSVEQENQPAQSDAPRPKLPPRRKKKGEEGC
ncbi:MAG: rhodanese-like domain-containing protein, partial [Calditrichaeota bacterium]|nr:rhodanese-like domain-containing protein [Calditrichota bacterium]